MKNPGGTPSSNPQDSIENDFVQQKYTEIKTAVQNGDGPAVFQLINEVEKYKLDKVAKNESKEGKEVKILGRGLEYTVYDIGDDRIRARHNSLNEQDDILCSWLIEPKEKRERISNSINDVSVASMDITKKLLDQKIISPETLGNPEFENESADYTRDAATSFSAEYIASHSLEENKAYIDN